MAMTPEKHLFVSAITENPNDMSPTKAAIVAGYAETYAWDAGNRLLRDPEVQEAIKDRINLITEHMGVKAFHVVKNWLDIATADPLKVAHVRRTCCRYCWGEGHHYQWTPLEYATAMAKALDAGKVPPTNDGGMDWEFNQRPCESCPVCMGEGVAELFIADMRTLSEKERKLIASVNQTKDGIKVTYHSQPDAWVNIAKWLGMLVDKKELTGPNGGPIQTQNANVNVNLSDLSPQDASKLYQAMIGDKS